MPKYRPFPEARDLPATLAVAASAAGAAFLRLPGELWPFAAGLSLLLCLSSAVDIRRFILPDVLTAAIALLGAIMIGVTAPSAWAHHLLGAVLGFGVLYLLALTWRRAFKKEGLGLGDAKLLGAIGLWTGWQGLPYVTLIASVSGLVVVLAVRASGRPVGRAPFGPFLSVGGWIVWVFAQPLF